MSAADISADQFQVYKSLAVIGALLMATMVQWVRPLDKSPGAVLRNWRVNLPLASINALAMAVVCGGCACEAARWAAEHQMGLLNSVTVNQFAAIVMTVVTLDFVGYAWHVANHRIPLLWRFHSVHHSDRVYDASTAVRFHLGELVVSLGVRLTVVVVLGLPIAGILAFEILYAFFNFFEHGNIALPAGISRRLAAVVVTPMLHRLHHSVASENLNSNFGTIFSFWDRIFRSFNGRRVDGAFKVGLPGDDER